MADTEVDGDIQSDLWASGGHWGPYWINTTTAVVILMDAARDVNFVRTTNGGVGWTTTTIRAGDASRLVAYFDQETPNDTGNLVHVGWLDETDDNAYYQTVDVSDASLGTLRTVDSTITVDADVAANRVALTKTRSGNLIYAFSTQTEIECYRSTDAGANWTDIADVYEGATQEDFVLLYPANTGFDDDACAIFGDRSAQTLSVKMWDDSAGTWTETSITGSIVQGSASMQYDGAIRHSDSHLLLASHVQIDTTTDDILTWDLTVDSIASPTVTAKTNVVTNVSVVVGSPTAAASPSAPIVSRIAPSLLIVCPEPLLTRSNTPLRLTVPPIQLAAKVNLPPGESKCRVSVPL